MIEIIKGFLILVCAFTVAMVIASFVSPTILIVLDRITKYFTKKPEQQTCEIKYRIYVPKPIQYLRSRLNFHNDKSGVKETKIIKHFNDTITKPRPENTINMVSQPITKPSINPSDNPFHADNSST